MVPCEDRLLPKTVSFAALVPVVADLLANHHIPCRDSHYLHVLLPHSDLLLADKAALRVVAASPCEDRLVPKTVSVAALVPAVAELLWQGDGGGGCPSGECIAGLAQFGSDGDRCGPAEPLGLGRRNTL